MIVVIDNTRNQKVQMFFPKLIKYLNKNDIDHCIIEGDINGLNELKKILKKKNVIVSGIILSGSPIMLNESSNVEDYICNLYCLKNLINIPILGICFGCQLINVYFGGNLYDLHEVKCLKMHIEPNDKNNEMWNSLNGNAQFCCRYLPQCVPNKHLNTLMYVNEKGLKLPCVIQHKKRNIIGVMFHPEALKKTHKVLDHFIEDLKNK
jgi:anthranilate/para-aminobenzoate synthase component II